MEAFRRSDSYYVWFSHSAPQNLLILVEIEIAKYMTNKRFPWITKLNLFWLLQVITFLLLNCLYKHVGSRTHTKRGSTHCPVIEEDTHTRCTSAAERTQLGSGTPSSRHPSCWLGEARDGERQGGGDVGRGQGPPSYPWVRCKLELKRGSVIPVPWQWAGAVESIKSPE